MSNFQTILVSVFLAFFIFAVFVFSGAIDIGKSSKKAEVGGDLVIWGFFEESVVEKSIFSNLDQSYSNLNIKYVQVDILNYQQKLIEAFALKKGPDLFIISSDMVKDNLDFIYKLPYESYTEKSFKDSFIDGANIYRDPLGIIGIPLLVDPIVMYYNKDILNNEGIVYPPQTWDELYDLSNRLTKRDNSGTIYQSMIAFGQYENINNAKDILATLLIQNNNKLVALDNDKYISKLRSNDSNFAIPPFENIVKFFVDFSNPSSNTYSWNRSLPSSLDMFTSGKLVFYLGRSSELFNIEELNPNLSFDIAPVPQNRDTKIKKTYGEIYSVVINKNSPNLAATFKMIGELSKPENIKNLSIATSLPPASKQVISSNKPTGDGSSFLSVFFDSSLISESWIDPSDKDTDSIFKELIESILSNRLSINDAINKADGQLNILLNK